MLVGSDSSVINPLYSAATCVCAQHLISYARTHNKVIIGPATVGGVQVGGWGTFV
jgi:hypothetical protein